jgi:UDP-glucuronate 4-epimerase
MTILVTGAAGFIGYHVAAALLARGERVVGVDNLDAYYDVALKRARLAELEDEPDFRLVEADIGERAAAADLAAAFPDISGIVHLAARAGVRYSLEDPFSYVHANIAGQVSMLELARRLRGLKHMVYASSSSVYGNSERIPTSIEDPTDRPASPYAATKRSGELMAGTFADIYRTPVTGLRLFTVYGPWGRPDMAVYGFARAVFDGTPVRLFNGGEMWRDFTFIDDIVAGILAALDRPPPAEAPHRLYNLGSGRSEKVTHLVSTLERLIGRPAIIRIEPGQSTDPIRTCADIDASRRDLGYEPATALDAGLPRFVDWYRAFHRAPASPMRLSV